MPGGFVVGAPYHEAGHAIVGMLTPGADPVRKVSIIPRGVALGVMLSAPEADRFSYDRPYLLGKIKVALGGRVAEEQVFDDITTGAQADIKDVTQLARRMVGLWGMSEAIGPLAVIPDDDQAALLGTGEVSPETAKAVDDEVRRLVLEALGDVRELLAEHRNELDALAEALLAHETLDADDAYRAAGLSRPPGRSHDRGGSAAGQLVGRSTGRRLAPSPSAIRPRSERPRP